jgi:hypothetical protein
MTASCQERENACATNPDYRSCAVPKRPNREVRKSQILSHHRRVTLSALTGKAGMPDKNTVATK